MRSKKTIYNIVSNLILQMVMVIYGFIVPRIIIGKFGSNVNGLISSITQFLSYITLLESGFGPVVKATLYKPIASKDNKTIASILIKVEKFFKMIAFIFIIYMIILCAIYPVLVNNSFDFLYTVSLIIIISISTFAEYFFGMTYKLYLQADQKAYIISIIQIFTYFLSVLVIVALSLFNCSIQILKLASGLIFVLRPIMQNLYFKKKYKINFSEADNNYDIKQKWDGLAQHVASVIHSNTDITVLTIFSTLAEVSVYSVYYLVVKGIKSIVQAFSTGIDAVFGNMMAKGENNNLNNKFNIYETLYFTIITILFTSTMILIVPFIKVYTKGITDTNYERQLFGYLIVISEYIWGIMQPYSQTTMAAGHFKETRIGAWIEAVINIVVSIILVNTYGIVGVAIGTIIAITVRCLEYIYHTNKYILKRNIFISLKKIAITIIETSIIVIMINYFIKFNIKLTYLGWFKYALICSSISAFVVLVINFILYNKEFKSIIKILNNTLLKRTNTNKNEEDI